MFSSDESHTAYVNKMDPKRQSIDVNVVRMSGHEIAAALPDICSRYVYAMLLVMSA